MNEIHTRIPILREDDHNMFCLEERKQREQRQNHHQQQRKQNTNMQERVRVCGMGLDMHEQHEPTFTEHQLMDQSRRINQISINRTLTHQSIITSSKQSPLSIVPQLNPIKSSQQSILQP